MGDVQARSTGVVLRLPDPALRPPRRSLEAHEPRGVILLFTGVRYERQSGVGRPHLFDGPGRSRRRS